MLVNGRLYRSRRDRMLAGVAGGLAEMWDADPSLVRIVWALLVLLTGGLALVVYIVMAIVVPEEDDVWRGGYGAYGGYAGPPGAPAAPGEPPAATAGGSVPGGSAPGGTGPDAQAWAAANAANEAHWAERRAARAARRADRGDGRAAANGALIGGALLILIGVFFLAREFLPTIDFDWFWPLVLVGLGAVLLVSAIRRDDHRDDHRGGPGGPS
jgi:phage shock protein C